MRGGKNTVGKIYPKYQPYPLSFDSKEKNYFLEAPDDSEPWLRLTRGNGTKPSGDFHDLISDPISADWFATKPLTSNDERPLRPLRLLQSLFADRLSFLQRTLEELESAKNERQQLIKCALDELDPEIQKCEQSLSTLVDMLNGRERRRDIERKLFELKRERRREALLSWRDLIWLKGEIRKHQREIDTFGRTAASAENRKAPT